MTPKLILFNSSYTTFSVVLRPKEILPSLGIFRSQCRDLTTDTRIQGCSSLLHKTVRQQYLCITCTHPYFKSSLDYLYLLKQCKCYVNSCKSNVNAMQIVASIQVNLSLLLELGGFFFFPPPGASCLWLFQSVHANPCPWGFKRQGELTTPIPISCM